MKLEVAADPETEQQILTSEAVDFVGELHARFGRRRGELLAARHARAADLEGGATLDFLAETRELREGDWQVAAPPPDYLDRRVEITGPTDRKLVINALNSGARGFMADFEDANSPTWANQVEGHVNLIDAIEGTIEYDSLRGQGVPARRRDRDAAGAAARLAPAREAPRDRREPGVGRARRLRPARVPRRPPARRAGARRLLLPAEARAPPRGAALERRLQLQPRTAFGLARGTLRATVLIETLPAAFQMDEILWELREHSLGLNAGRWDYIFSMIKCFRDRPEFVLPDRNDVKMTVPFMRAYSELLVEDLPRARRLRDGRDGGADPVAQGRRGQRAGDRRGPRGQGARGEGRLRRHVGRASRRRPGGHRGVRPRARRPAEPDLEAARRTSRSARPTCSTPPRRRARSPRRACAATSTSASSTSRSGSAAAARPGSTT